MNLLIEKDDSETSNRRNYLKERVLVGIPIGIFLIALGFIRGIPFAVLLTIVAVLCQYEMTQAMRSAGYSPTKRTAIIFGLLIYPSYLYSPNATLVLFALLVTYNLIWGVFKKNVKFEDAIVSSFTLCYPGSFFLALIMIGEILPYELSVFVMIIALLSPAATDVGAYFVGTFFGKRKLAPEISPKKTVEGAIGGVASSIIIVGAVYFILLKTNVLQMFPDIIAIEWYHVMICALLCSFFSQIGDLIASAVKRFAKIKDFSRVLLGHGGIMDRLDSILFSATIALVYFSLILR